LTDWIPDPEPGDGIRHEVQRQLDLVATLGAHTADTKLSLMLPSLAEEAALKALALAGIDTLRPWIVLHPGASSAKRRYSASGFIEVGKELRDREGLQIVVTGSKDEAELADKIATSIGEHAYSLAGKVPMETFLGVIALTPLLISNNTGPVHIAAALQTPVVDLYALTNPQHTPWEVSSKVLSFPVEKQYLPVISDQIPENATELTSPEDIVQAALELLSAHVNLSATANRLNA
jgi:ADP-heptose:LPS heptosyltransferase